MPYIEKLVSEINNRFLQGILNAGCGKANHKIRNAKGQ